MIDIGFFLFLISVTSCGIILWARYFRNPVPYNHKVFRTPFGLVDVLICFCATWLAPGFAAMFLMMSFGAESEKDLSSFQLNLILFTVSMLQLTLVTAVVFYAIKRYGSAESVLGLDKNKLINHVVIAAKAFAMTVPLILMLQQALSLLLPYEHATLTGLQERFSFFTLLVSWLGAVIVAPIFEEILFRGFLQGWLQRINLQTRHDEPVLELMGGWEATVELEAEKSLGKMAWWWPIVASSGFFAAVHLGQGLAPVALFFFSLVLGFLYRYTGSIVPCIVLHFFLNAMSMSKATLDVAFGNV